MRQVRARAGTIRVRENVLIELRDRRGRLVRRDRVANLVVTAGLNWLRDRMDDTSGPLTHFAVGTSSTAPASGQTALVAEVYRTVISQRDKPSTGVIVHRCFVPTTAANGQTLREAGLFTAASGGTMLSRIVFTPIAKTNAISVTIQWTHTLSTS